MDRVLGVSEAEIDDAFAQMLGIAVDEDDPSFRTIMQLANEYGLDRQVTARRAAKAVKAGRAEMRRVRRAGEDGRLRTLQVYRPVPQ